ncbi:MAG: DUF882 domain-containing protein [Deltaproteobacteria bacterium]|nr:DUF882 domain-containing protein [Deltaproteobacteria bacterium]
MRLRARAVVTLALALAATAALPAIAHADHDKSKKDRERSGKAAHRSGGRRALPVPGKPAPPLVNLYNSWTHEWLAVGPGDPPPQVTVDRFLRDHYTNRPTGMEPRLIDILLAAAAQFKSDTIFVVSAFRHPKYNLILRKKGHQVARDSHHTKGNAVDFSVPRVTTQRLHAWAKEQAIGGVGLYLGSGFVHMDTGKIRYWNGE